MEPVSILTVLSSALELAVKVRDGAARWLLWPLIVFAAVVTLPCMVGVVSPAGLLGALQEWVDRVVGIRVNLSRAEGVTVWMAAHSELGLYFAVLGFLAGLASYRASRLRDGALAVAWLAALCATLSGHGKLLLASFGSLLCFVEAAAVLLSYRVPRGVAFMRYPMRLTAVMPIRYLFWPAMWIARAATGHGDDGPAGGPELPTGAVTVPGASPTEIMMRVAYRRLDYHPTRE